MHVVSACPLPVSSWLWQSSPSAWTLTVICRATFLLEPSESVLAPDQEPPTPEDDYWNDDAGRSLRVASDLVPLKLRPDVTLVGHAFAPKGKTARSLAVRLLVGEIDKVIDVHCDRFLDANGALEQGPPFSRMPLHYERASGGPETPNPVGMRGVPDVYGRVALPNLQPHGLVVSSPSDYIAPAGFGPIAPSWPSRRGKLGRSAVSGRPPHGQTQPLPADLDRSYFNHAPHDQQPEELRENERIILENLHPDHERLVTSLPGVRPRATVERRGGMEAVPLRCDTLWIDTDRALCTLTWRGQVPLSSPDEEGRVVFTLDASSEEADIASLTIDHIEDDAVEDAADTLVPAVRPSAIQAQAMGNAADTMVPAVYASALPSSALPFAPPRPSAQPQRAPVSGGRSGERAGTAGGGLPFVQRPPAPPPQRRAPAPAPAPAPALVTPPPAQGPIAPVMSPSRWSVADVPTASAPPPMTVGQRASTIEPAPAASPSNDESSRLVIKVDAPKAEAPKAEATKVEVRKAIQLLWFDPETLPRIRRKPAYQAILMALEDRPLDPDFDDPGTSKHPVDVEDRRDAFEVMARGEATSDETKLNEAVDRAVREDGKFMPPLLLIDGEVRLPFDELATLKATLSIASPFAPGDEPLKVAVADARELLRTADLMCTPGVFEGFTTLVQEAFRKIRRTTTPPGYLEEQTERALLERRSYQRREVFGATYVRALLQVGNGPRPWPLYLPEDAAKKLPMFTRFQARVFADACLQEDQYEVHPIALRVVALSRLAPMASKVGSKPSP